MKEAPASFIGRFADAASSAAPQDEVRGTLIYTTTLSRFAARVMPV